jgi:hypothetical protein
MAETSTRDADSTGRYQAFMEAIRQRVCAVCLDQRDDGACGLQGRTCAIEKHLPSVVAAVSAIESDRMDEYVQAIEAQVCAGCEEQAGHACALRKHGECALDTYLYLVVEAIQEVKAREAKAG